MDVSKLSEEGRGVYKLLRTDLTSDLEQRLKGQGDVLLQPMEKLIEANTATLDGLISARMDGVREEMALKLEQICGELHKDIKPSVDG